MAHASGGHSVAPRIDEHDDDVHEGHPGELTYIKVAAILALITVGEVAIYYIQWMHDSGALVPTLLVLSAIKFATVIAYFMHLKFDPRMLTWTFIFGISFGAALILAFIALFNNHPIQYATNLLA
jgi:cytochrome c oxidase subunit IV